MKPVLVDTGVIVALLDRSERSHARCVAVMEGFERPLVTCEAVIAESCYLLRRLPGATETRFRMLSAESFRFRFNCHALPRPCEPKCASTAICPLTLLTPA